MALAGKSIAIVTYLHNVQATASIGEECTGVSIRSGDGNVVCVDAEAWSTKSSVAPKPLLGADAVADIDECFRSYCSSSAVRDLVIGFCQGNPAYNCDAMQLKDTYVTDLASGQATYGFVGSIVYDNDHAEKSVKKTGSRFTQTFKNNNDHDSDFTEFAHELSETASYTWSSSTSTSVTASVDLNIAVDIPEVAKVSVDAGYSHTSDWTKGTSSTDSTTQTFRLTQHINEEPQSCTRACVLATEGTVSVPYTMTGTFTGQLPGGDAFSCCYSEGGVGDCSTQGRVGQGIVVTASAALAVQQETCPGFGFDGIGATFSTTGDFQASMDFEADVVTVKGSYDSCPDESACNSDSIWIDSAVPEFV